MNAEKHKTLLLVEDEAIIAMAEKMTLEKYGYRVLIAHGGEEAVAAVANTPGIDLILMDIDLGKGMDGTEAAALILKERDLPVVFLSSHTEPEVVEKTEKITSYGYVVKDSSGTVLDASIKMAFKLFYAKISEKKKELALSQSNELLTKLARLVPGVIYQYRLDPDGRSAFPYSSPGMNDIYEVTPEEVRDDATPVFTRLHPDDYDTVAGAIQASALTLNTFYCEFRVLLPRQGLRWRWSQAHPERLADGGTLWHGIIMDVTERKLAEEALRASEERYRAIFDFSPYAVLLTDPDGRVLAANAAAGRLFALTEAEIMRAGRAGLLDAADPKLAAAMAERDLAGKFHGELTFIRKGGERFTGEVFSQVFKDRDGNARTSTIIHDIAESRQAEQALRQSEERWRDILFSMGDWVWEVDEKGVYTYSSDKGQDFLGASRGDILGKTPFDFMPPEEAARMKPIFQELVSGKKIIKDLENWNIGKNGEPICLLTNGVPILDEKGNLKGYRGVDKDITGRKRAEETLQNTLRFQQALMDAVPSPVFYKDANCVYMGGNKAFELFIGLAREQFIGKTVHDIAPADLAGKYDRADKELLENRGTQTYEASVAHADGAIREVVFHKAVFTDGEGRLAGLIGVILDITERKQAQAALRASEAMQSNALQMTRAGHWEYDVDRDLFTFNDNFYRIFRTTAAAVGGYRLSSEEYARRFLHPDDTAMVAMETRGAIATSDPNYSRQIEHRILYADGEIGWIAVRFFIVKDDQGRTIKTYGVNQDISGRKRAQQEIQRQLAEKEVLLKEVHHRIKNNFASVAGLLSLRLQTVASPEAAAVLKDAASRVDSMRLLYDKLLLGDDYKDVSVKNYVESLALSVIALFPDSARVTLEQRIDDFQLDAKRLFPLGIIINELLTNVMKYAFSNRKGGSIRISLARARGRVTLTVQDDGPGFPDGFDLEKSQGFGLMLVKMLSNQLGGSFTSDRHKGARCRLVFAI